MQVLMVCNAHNFTVVQNPSYLSFFAKPIRLKDFSLLFLVISTERGLGLTLCPDTTKYTTYYLPPPCIQILAF